MFSKRTRITYKMEKFPHNADNERMPRILVTVENGLGVLKQEFIGSGDQMSRHFRMGKDTVYTATDEGYWSPTCEKLIRRHHAAHFESLTLTNKLADYRLAMGKEKVSFDELLQANEMIFSLLASGTYRVSLKTVFPTFGENEIFSSFHDEQRLDASVEGYYRWLGDDALYIHNDVRYMLPTQHQSLLSEEALENARFRPFLGRGLVLGYVGFLGCLLDGHHKATVAYERKSGLECLVIEELDKITALGAVPVEELVEQSFFNHLSTNLPMIEDYCYIAFLMNKKKLTSHDEVMGFVREVLDHKRLVSETDMASLISYCYAYAVTDLLELYPLLKHYMYKDSRVDFFEKLSMLDNSETLDNLMLDYLINDEYDNLAITRICDAYFSKQL